MWRQVHDSLDSNEEVELVGSLLQEIQDLGDVWDDLGPANQVREEHRITKQLEELESLGFLLFGSCRTVTVSFPDSPTLPKRVKGQGLAMTEGVFLITRTTNPKLVHDGTGEIVAPVIIID